MVHVLCSTACWRKCSEGNTIEHILSSYLVPDQVLHLLQEIKSTQYDRHEQSTQLCFMDTSVYLQAMAKAHTASNCLSCRPLNLLHH